MSQTVHIDTDGQKIYATCESFSNKDLIGLVAGAKWREAQGRWECPLTWASAKCLRNLLGEDLELSEGMVEWGHQEYETRIEPCMALRDLLNPGQPYPIEFDNRLYPYQVAGAQFLAAAKHAILSDPVGSGKSNTAISAAKLLDALPALVIAPKSTLISWQREIERWWPGTPVQVIDGNRKTRATKILECQKEKAFCIIGWEAVRLHSRLAPYGSTRLRHCSDCDRSSDQPWTKCERCPKELNAVDWKLVIADESHRMANISKQTRAAWSVGHIPSVEFRWALTGTPMTKQVDTIWSPLHFINPEEWPSKVQFIDRYALIRIVPWGSGSEVIGLNPANEEEFQEIFKPRLRRMPKEIILPQLPPIIRTRRYIEMSDVQRRCYEEMAEDMVTETESGELLIAANPAVKMLRMVQFSSATVDMLTVPQEDDDEEVFVARLVDPSNKLDALMDDLPDLLAADESIIVFAVSRQLIEMAEKRLDSKKIKYSVIKGNQKPAFRQQQIDDFQNKKVPLILVVIAAGGTGVNLQQGRIEIFLQRSWSFIDNHQAEGRGIRLGSEKYDSIEIIDYLSRETVDQTVCDVADGKEVALERIVRDKDAIKKLLQGDII